MAEAFMKYAPCTPEQFPKPFVTTADAKALLTKLYDLRPTSIESYPSYSDKTFYVKTAPDEGIKGQTEFILKVLNAKSTSCGPGAVAVQVGILNHLRSFAELRCQAPVPTVDGRHLSYEMIRNDCNDGAGVKSQDALSAVIMYGYLPGQILYDVSPISPTFFYKAGRHLGNLQLALQTYPGDIDPLKRKATVSPWCSDQFPWIKRHLELVTDASRRALLEEVIEEFERNVVPMHGVLRKGIVNNDFSNYNLLVTPFSCGERVNWCDNSNQMTRSDDFEVSGVIDFDLVMHTYLVYEIAVAMAYLMQGNVEPLEVTAYLLAGFESRAPLPQKERRLLRVLTAVRLAQSVVYGLTSAKLNPENSYLTTTQTEGWKCLKLLWSKSEQELLNLWDEIQMQQDFTKTFNKE